MPAANTKNTNKKNNNNNNGGGIFDKIISLIFILALLAGGVFFLVKNEIDSVDKFMDFFREKSDHISGCFESDEFFKCVKEGFAPGIELPNGENGEHSNVNTQEVLTKLENIPLSEPSDDDYDRSEYKHWSTVEGSCNTREVVLKEQGTNVIVDEDCSSTAGEWVDPYTGETISDASKSDIDHVIPLGYANAHGAADWDADKKESFANDISQLLAVSASENRSKSDSGPSEYMPPNKDFHCEYSAIWVETADKYDLSITVDDRDVLRETLQNCG